MSLLFDFIKNLPPSERGKVTAQSFKGKTEMLFRAVIAQAETGVFEREFKKRSTFPALISIK
jgi:hypothetical protein